MPVTRRGCIVLYRSKDLVNWEYYGPIYSPGHTNCPECPEMYKMGDNWYLSYSRFSEYVNTIYRVSKSPFGPWRKLKKDGIGGRRFYAAKSMQDDNGRRFYFGWAHDRADRSDNGEWYWGGTFCIPHEVVATDDGGLDVKLPKEYENIFEKPVIWNLVPVMGDAHMYGSSLVEMDSIGTCTYGFLDHKEESYMLKCKIMPREVYDHFGILLKSDREASGCLLLEFDVAMQRVSLVNLPMGVDPFWVQSCQAVPPATEPGPDGVRVCEKTFYIIEGKEIEVYWLDSNEGDLIKAIAYCGGRYICEVQPMPKFQRAHAEQTEADMVAKALQDAYTMTIVRFVQHHSKQIAEVGIINRAPARQRAFVIPSLKRYEATNTTDVEILTDYDSLDEDDKQIFYNPSTEYTQSWRNKYAI